MGRLPAALLFLASASALAQTHVVLTPQASSLLSGRSLAFHVALAFGGDQRPVLGGRQVDLPRPGDEWVWSILDGGVGTLDPATGTYTAPLVDRPELVRVKLQCRPIPDLAADAMILVLPHAPFDVVGKVLGPDWLEPHRGDRPYLDASASLAPDPASLVRLPSSPGPRLLAGCGLPASLRPRPLTGTQTLLLRDDSGDLRRDLTGQDAAAIPTTVFLRKVTVEALQRAPGRENLWWGFAQTFPVHLRGLVPLAGNTVAGPGHLDGTGPSARFREPFGVLKAPEEGPDGFALEGFLVTDAGSHTLRLVSLGGEVRTLWGSPDEPGHRETTRPTLLGRLALAFNCRNPGPLPARFNRPTFLDAYRYGFGWHSSTWWCAVADTGNHVVRKVALDGTTQTLAGAPGQAGHRDGRQALFHEPQGVAVDVMGNVYVADRGNCVIRLIRANGEVETVAGRPGEPGSRDGRGDQAQFRALRGLVLSQGPHATQLYLADGHALRRLELAGREVTTVLGQVDTPGFRDVQGGSRGHRRLLLREPCLDRPCGLVVREGAVEIADEGNHAVRRFDRADLTLATLAGHPLTPGLRWGLVRDGLEGPLDAPYATLEAPRGLAVGPGDGLAVATGTCLAALLDAREGRDRVRLSDLTCTPPRAGETCLVQFDLEFRTGMGAPAQRTVQLAVDLLEADGTLGQRLQGTVAGPGRVTVQGEFQQRGAGAVAVRAVSDQGVSVGARIPVQVR